MERYPRTIKRKSFVIDPLTLVVPRKRARTVSSFTAPYTSQYSLSQSSGLSMALPRANPRKRVSKGSGSLSRHPRFRKPTVNNQVRSSLDGPKLFRFKKVKTYTAEAFHSDGNPAGDVSSYHDFYVQPMNHDSNFSYIGAADKAALSSLYKEFRVKSWSIKVSRHGLIIGGAGIGSAAEYSEDKQPMLTTVVHTHVANTSTSTDGSSLTIVPTFVTPFPRVGWDNQVERTGNTVSHGGTQMFSRVWSPISSVEGAWQPFDDATVLRPFGGLSLRARSEHFVNQQGEDTVMNNDQPLIDVTLTMVIECRGRR